MNHAVRNLLIASFVVAIATPLHAQRGCFHSPEAPTDVLFALGTAGMVFGPLALARLRKSLRKSPRGAKNESV